MLLETNPGGTIIRSNVGKSFQFGIKNPQIVMQTLSSLYNNACKIVVQEYISNARDAHREVNKDDLPVEVSLPSPLDPTLKIRDFGPGLSVERIQDVFIMFGESTKRDDNTQTGGFGIGAKCGLAYNTKSFMVDSYTIENGTNFKRTYSVFLNEEDIPEMTLLSEDIIYTNETGVEISVNILYDDIYNIQQYIKDVCEFWTTTPIIKNGTLEFPNREVIYKGKNFVVYKTEKDYSGIRRGHIFAVLDGIIYPIPESIFNNATAELKSISNITASLHFNTGEIYAAANRENLKINTASLELLKNRLHEIYTSIRASCLQSITHADNLYTAYLKWIEFSEHVGKNVIKNVEWNGFKIANDYMDCPSGSSVFVYLREKYNTTKRITASKEMHLSFVDNSILLFNDEVGTYRPTPAKIRTVFETTTANVIQVIHTNSALSKTDWDKNGLTELGAINISTIPKSKTTYGRSNTKSSVIKCYAFTNLCNKRAQCWKPVDIDLANDAGVYVTLSRYDINENIAYSLINKVTHQFGITVYGITQRYVSKLKHNENMITLKQYIKEQLEELKPQITSLQRLFASKDYNNYRVEQVSISTYQSHFITQYIVKKLPHNHPIKKLNQLYKILRNYYIKHNTDTSIIDKVSIIESILNISVLEDNTTHINILKKAHQSLHTPLLNMVNWATYRYETPPDEVIDFVFQQLNP